MVALALQPTDLRPFEGEPRVHDLRLADVLGYQGAKEVRQTIRRHRDELLMHGVLAQSEAKPLRGSTGGRPERAFMLNEPQALLVCMFSRTERAAQVRNQIIQVFLAYRRGQLVEGDGWSRIERRIDQLERLMGMQASAETEEFAVAITYAPSVFRLHHPDGRLRGQRYPNFWGDLEVRRAATAIHRQMTIARAVSRLSAEFGPERAPSKSALHRYWKQLDKARGTA
jgi:hypothetical protein